MITISVSELQRKMSTVVMPAVASGEEIQVIDKKAGTIKFHIVPPKRDSEIDWGDFADKLITIESQHEDPTAVALAETSSDKYFS